MRIRVPFVGLRPPFSAPLVRLSWESTEACGAHAVLGLRLGEALVHKLLDQAAA